MPIDFPNSPSNGSTHTVNGVTWEYDGTAWNVASGGAGLRVSATAPTSPATGDLWYDSESGKVFIYYDSQWVSPAVVASVPTASAGTITGSNSEGTASTFARSDHNHAFGSKSVPASALALGPSYETSLPGSPVDGQEIYYAADASNGVIWHLRYRSGASGSYKWEYVGGGRLYARDEDGRTVTSTTFADLPTDQIFVSIPLAGEYVVEQSAFANVAATTTYGVLSFAITNSSNAISGSGTAEATDDRGAVIETNSTNPGYRTNISARNVVEVSTATYRLRERGRVGSNSVSFSRRRLFVTPIRVG